MRQLEALHEISDHCVCSRNRNPVHASSVVGLGGGNGDCRLVDVDPEQVGSSAANLLEGDQSLALSSSDNVAKVTLTEAWRNGGQSGDVHGSKYI